MTATPQPQHAQDVLAAFIGAVSRQERVALATVVQRTSNDAPQLGVKLLVREDGTREGTLDLRWVEQVAADALTALAAGHSQSFLYPRPADPTRGAEERADFRVYVEVAGPPRLLVVGAGNIGAAVARLAKVVGFHVAVLDDRPDFANADRLPDVDTILCADIVETLRSTSIDDRTSVVVVTRGHKQDESAVREVVESAAGYIGMIGSRRRASAVLQLLRESGVPSELLARVRTPIGLDIGAETPEEIAVSIVAELLMVRRGGSGLPLADLAGINKLT